MSRPKQRQSPPGSACTPRSVLVAIFLLSALTVSGRVAASTTQVFSTDFESGYPAEFTAHLGSGLEGVQGYAGLGPTGNQFGGNFLRYTEVTLHPTTLVLTGLPAHDHVDLDFLLAVIDSWDGTELFQVRVDDVLLFSHLFQLATGDTSDYIAPVGGLLSRGVDLGFSGCCYYNRDRAYNMAVEPVFHAIAHTASTLTVEWSIGAVSGPAAAQWQGGSDESWGIDNVRVSVTDATSDVGPRGADSGLGLGAARPNPSRSGALAISFVLASARAATLEVLDVMGRRVFARDVGVLGAGAHTLDVGRELGLAPGIYRLRLTQGNESREARAVVLQ